MEITFKDGDRITIPEGCKATIDGNEVVIEKKEQEFKDGDILACKEKFSRCPFIFKGYDDKGFQKFHAGIGYGRELIICKEDGERWGNSELSYATDEEKQLLLDTMKQKGLRWNAKEKRVEKIMWRANDKRAYYCIRDQGDVMVNYEAGFPADEDKWEFGNYFRTSEQAEKATKAVRETLRKFHEENEENL